MAKKKQSSGKRDPRKVVAEAVKALKALAKERPDKGVKLTGTAFKRHHGRLWEKYATFSDLRERAGIRPPSIADEAIEEYANLVRKLGHRPTTRELGALRVKLSHNVGPINRVDKIARERFPDLYKDRIFAEVQPTLRARGRRFLITTAVGSTQLHEGFWSALNLYARKLDAQIIVMAMADPAHVRSQGLGTYDERLQGSLLTHDLRLNMNCMVGGALMIGAKQIDPVTGLNRIGHRSGTFIFAGPKVRLRYVPVSPHSHPHAITSTGACTVSNYSTDLTLSRRTAYLADVDHQLGACVVELVNDRLFHFRHIHADADGAFYDLDQRVTPNEVTKTNALALTPGDWHTGLTDPGVRDAVFRMLKRYSPRYAILHDLLDSNSISHHDIAKNVFQSRKARRAFAELSPYGLSLSDELDANARELEMFLETGVKPVIVPSNHPEHLARYLEEGRYIRDHVNFNTAVEILAGYKDGADPFAYAMRLRMRRGFEQVRFLERDEPFILHGVHYEQHGDKGPNGSRGTIRNIETAYRECVIGHSHTAQILRGAYQVGTSTYRQLLFTQGPSSWTHTSCLTHEDGSRQLINVIEGEWTTL